jgi:hypothetical protein
MDELRPELGKRPMLVICGLYHMECEEMDDLTASLRKEATYHMPFSENEQCVHHT